jgi:pyruvate,orthophosphate dikinase
MGKACVVSCAGLVVDPAAPRADIGDIPLNEGDWISVDGDTGEVFLGQLEIAMEGGDAG